MSTSETTLQEDRAELVAQIQQATKNILACSDERTVKQLDAEVTLLRNSLAHLDAQIKAEEAAEGRRKREEFAKRQNCDSVKIKASIVFQNGAVVWADGTYSDPREDKNARNRIQFDFYTAKLEQIQAEADKIRKNVRLQAKYHAANAGNSPDEQMPGWEARLAELDSEIAELEEKTAEYRETLPPSTNTLYWRDRNYRIQQAQQAVNRTFNPSAQS